MLQTQHNLHVYGLQIQRESQLTAPQLINVMLGLYWLLMHWLVSAGCSGALKTLCWTRGRNLWHIFMEAEGLIFSLCRMFQLVRASGAVAPGMVSYFIAGPLLNYFSVHTWRSGEHDELEWGREGDGGRLGAAPAAEAWCELSCWETSRQMFPELKSRSTETTYGNTTHAHRAAQSFMSDAISRSSVSVIVKKKKINGKTRKFHSLIGLRVILLFIWASDINKKSIQ